MIACLVVTVATVGWTVLEPSEPDVDVTTQTPPPDAAAGALGYSETAEDPAPTPSAAATATASEFGDVPPVGDGAIVVVPGNEAAPGPGLVKRVRVEIEGGLGIDGAAFASTVMATLNDPRSWGAGGTLTFARTDGEADMRVVLASPVTSEQMCEPLGTGGTLSCAKGTTAVITLYRWTYGSDDYAAYLDGYRQYVVNHEVGHVLGEGHVDCPAAGALAPVMMQQTKGIKDCLPNPWPYPATG